MPVRRSLAFNSFRFEIINLFSKVFVCSWDILFVRTRRIYRPNNINSSCTSIWSWKVETLWFSTFMCSKRTLVDIDTAVICVLETFSTQTWFDEVAIKNTFCIRTTLIVVATLRFSWSNPSWTIYVARCHRNSTKILSFYINGHISLLDFTKFWARDFIIRVLQSFRRINQITALIVDI